MYFVYFGNIITIGFLFPFFLSLSLSFFFLAAGDTQNLSSLTRNGTLTLAVEVLITGPPGNHYFLNF